MPKGLYSSVIEQGLGAVGSNSWCCQRTLVAKIRTEGAFCDKNATIVTWLISYQG